MPPPEWCNHRFRRMWWCAYLSHCCLYLCAFLGRNCNHLITWNKFWSPACSAEDAKPIHCISLSCFLGVCCLSVLIAKMAMFDSLGDKRSRWHVLLLKANPLLLFAVPLCAFVRIYILNDQGSNKPAWHLIIKEISSGLYLKRESWFFFSLHIPLLKSILSCFISACFTISICVNAAFDLAKCKLKTFSWL